MTPEELATIRKRFEQRPPTWDDAELLLDEIEQLRKDLHDAINTGIRYEEYALIFDKALGKAQAENERLRDRCRELEAVMSKTPAQWCLEERAAGNGGCGACSICCGELHAENERLREACQTALAEARMMYEPNPELEKKLEEVLGV